MSEPIKHCFQIHHRYFISDKDLEGKTFEEQVKILSNALMCSEIDCIVAKYDENYHCKYNDLDYYTGCTDCINKYFNDMAKRILRKERKKNKKR